VISEAIAKRIVAPKDLAPLKPFIDAIADGIGVMLDESRADALLERAAGIERVRDAHVRLARQGDPLGLAEGVLDDPCDDSNAPNAYQATKAEFELRPTTNVAGRDRSSEAWAKIQIVDRMYRDKDILEHHYLAAQKFRRDYIKGMAVTGLTARYQPRVDGSSGTPIAQQASFRLDPADIRTHHHSMWAAAVKALDDRFDAYWLERIVCEAYEVAREEPPTLADVGRSYMGYKCSKQASAAGATIVRKALERLAKHYGMEAVTDIVERQHAE
jgi:hypothetical protein